MIRAPFPWFGGKSRAAHLVWQGFGDVPNYVEPFAGSLAVLLGRPTAPRIETVNDLDCYLANFWRAVKWAPEEVAEHADWPVNEADLHARHRWLVAQTDFRTRPIAAPPPSPQPSPEPKKEDPMPQTPTATRQKCPTPRCPTILRSNNKKGLCGYCQAGKTAHLLPEGSEASDDASVGETAAPAKKAPGKKKAPAPVIAGGVEKLRLVAEALGFNADAVLDELAGEWLATVGNQVREAAR